MWRTLLLLLLASPASAEVIGYWQSPTKAVVRAEPCGMAVCLTLVTLPPDAPTNVDHHNPDEALRKRPLCGLQIGSGFQRSDADHLDGGRLYDPKTGHTYKGTIAVEGNVMKLHGYIGISALGRTEEWHRVPAVPTCH